MGELVKMVEKICSGYPACPAIRGAGQPCPAIMQLAREIELLWDRIGELYAKRK